MKFANQHRRTKAHAETASRGAFGTLIRVLLLAAIVAFVAFVGLPTWHRRWVKHASVTELKNAVRKNPSDCEAWLSLVRAMQRGPLHRNDLPILESAVQHCPNNAGLIARLGILKLALGQDEEAAELIDHAVQISPTSWDAHYAVVLACEKRSLLPDALRELHALVKARPDDPLIWFHLGYCEASLNHLSAGADCLQQSARLNPRNAECWTVLGRTLALMGEPARAELAYKKSVSLNPRDAVAWKELATLYTEWSTGPRVEDALRAYQQALSIDPGLPGIYGPLGTLYEGQRDWKKALAAWQGAAAIDPFDEQPLVHLAEIYEQLGNAEMADKIKLKLQKLGESNAIVDALKAHVLADPADLDAQKRLGELYASRGEKKQAL